MIGYYDIMTKLQKALQNDPFIKYVTKGGYDTIGTNKQDMYPTAHVNLETCKFSNNVTIYPINISCFDLVDYTKEPIIDIFIGNDNEDDVLNTTQAILSRLYQSLKRGDLFDDSVIVEGDAELTLFVERFEDNVAGWTMQIDIIVENDMTIC